MTKQKPFRIKLYRYRATRGFEEEIVLSRFFPGKVDGFSHLRNVCQVVNKPLPITK